MYIAIICILLLLAVFDLVVGVSNDAANFLNSAIGSRAAKRSVIVAVAAVGVILGASLSNGMMEIAKSGVFTPSEFTFNEVMMLFLAVMLTDVILLDLFNTFGLPTSTTVSMVFELLGAAIAVAYFKMANDPEASQNLGKYINTTKVFQIISGIFLSIAVAFTCGCITMWFSRMVFSFRYQKSYRYVGAIWVAISLTAITYFAIFKGFGKSSIMSKENAAFLNDNMAMLTGYALLFWFVVSFFLQNILKLNTLKLTVLAGTGALALAFAGNDLVNFIGVFMAAESSFHYASEFAAAGGDVSTLKMGILAEKVNTNMYYLVGAGLIMVAALFFSKKARTVSDTEVKLARNTAAKERFGSTLAARMMVRSTVNTVKTVKKYTPRRVQVFVKKRFQPLPPSEDNGAAFDLIRASVNLTVSALLITYATSHKLPLSTTYVTFMVAMGSSLADRAWGRESAVYRITGVLTVIGGWFMTGLAASTGAFLTATLLMNLGGWGIIIMIAVVFAFVLKTTLYHRNNAKQEAHTINFLGGSNAKELRKVTAKSLEDMLDIYRATVNTIINDDFDTARRLRKQSKEIYRNFQHRMDDEVMPTLAQLPSEHAEEGEMIYHLTESSLAVSKNLLTIVKTAHSHLDNNHKSLGSKQAAMLLDMCDKLNKFFPHLCHVIRKGDSVLLIAVMEEANKLSDEFADNIARYIKDGKSDERNLRNHILYLNFLNETRSMVYAAIYIVKGKEEMFIKADRRALAEETQAANAANKATS